MRLSNSFFYTIREDSKNEESISGNLLVRSGMIKKEGTGNYMFMPMGYKVLKNIENIIRDEMNKVGAQELLMPSLIHEDVYAASGRNKTFGSSIFKLRDRFNKPYILGPTHEELFTIAAKQKIRSYKDLPFNLYQFQTKFRDEPRPRYGLIRVREFIMKDAYSFDTNLEELDKSYKLMDQAYENSFDRMQLEYKKVVADTGAMGGLLSEEFQAITEIGEDTLVLCNNYDYASNIEVSECITDNIENEEPLEKELIETKNVKTIEEVTSFLDMPSNKFVKTLIYEIDKKPYACLVRGDRDVNEAKVLKLVGGFEINLADYPLVEEITNAKVGFAGPINLDIPIIVDNEVLEMSNFVVGANKTDYHYKNVNIDDFKCDYKGDIRNAQEGDTCPKCGGKIIFKKGIEVGNLFKLGTKYSEALNLNYLDENNELHPVVMGSYGIGLGRCMAAIVEQHHDKSGIIWPMSVAPYKVIIVLISNEDEKQVEIANDLHEKLNNLKIDTILDDRDERPGVKFNDADLIGIPIRITVGKKVSDGKVEIKLRSQKDNEEIDIKDVISKVEELINEQTYANSL